MFSKKDNLIKSILLSFQTLDLYTQKLMKIKLIYLFFLIILALHGLCLKNKDILSHFF